LKRIFIIFLCIFLFIAIPLHAQKKTDLLLKFSKQEGTVRIVFEAEDVFINNAKVTTSPSQIKIDFPELFNLTSPKEFPFELTPVDKTLSINVKEKGEIKFFRLSSPARLVFDFYTSKKEPKADNQALKQAEPHPVKQPAQVISKSFVIDAGHGGYDFGIRFETASEKDMGLDLAKDLNALLTKKGKKVFLVRKADQYVSLSERINFVNQKNPDVFISLHFSLSRNFVIYSPRLDEQGLNETADTYSLSAKQKKFIEKSRLLSGSIGKALKDEFKGEVVQREMPLPILRSAGAPSVLIECPSPAFVAYDQQMKTRLINSIVNGIAAYGQ